MGLVERVKTWYHSRRRPKKSFLEEFQNFYDIQPPAPLEDCEEEGCEEEGCGGEEGEAGERNNAEALEESMDELAEQLDPLEPGNYRSHRRGYNPTMPTVSRLSKREDWGVDLFERLREWRSRWAGAHKRRTDRKGEDEERERENQGETDYLKTKHIDTIDGVDTVYELLRGVDAMSGVDTIRQGDKIEKKYKKRGGGRKKGRGRVKGVRSFLSRIFHKRKTGEQEKHEPLERIIKDSVAQYNKAIEDYRRDYRRGNKEAIHNRYINGASKLDLPVEVYKDALREHVASSAKRYETGRLVEGYGRPAEDYLQRFDRGLLPDYQSFSAEVADLYVTNPKMRVKDIAGEMAKKYGMRISASHVSRIAREELKKSIGYVANRREAQKRWREQGGGGRPGVSNGVSNSWLENEALSKESGSYAGGVLNRSSKGSSTDVFYTSSAKQEGSDRGLEDEVRRTSNQEFAGESKRSNYERGPSPKPSLTPAYEDIFTLPKPGGWPPPRKEDLEENIGFEALLANLYAVDERNWDDITDHLNKMYGVTFTPGELEGIARVGVIFLAGHVDNRSEARKRFELLGLSRKAS